MKRNLICFLFILLLSATGINRLFPQSTGETISSGQIRNIIESVNSPDARLVSGTLYRGARRGKVADNPYYISEDWKQGYVIIDSVLFDSLLLKYDILDNKLVLNTANFSPQAVQLCVNLQKTSRFGMEDQIFIPFPDEKDKPDPWFSELVVEDTLSYIIYKRKTLDIDGGGSDYRYNTNEVPYLIFNNELSKFRSRRTFYRTFPGLKTEIRRFIRRERLVYINKRPENLRKITEYCNTLLNNNR